LGSWSGPNAIRATAPMISMSAGESKGLLFSAA
jgi:hypothetical protein